MSPSDREYLADYSDTAAVIRRIRVRLGWAVGRGEMKRMIQKNISYAVTYPFTYPFFPLLTAGEIDAILDSVGC